MQIVEQGVKVAFGEQTGILQRLEDSGRICYNSQGKATDESAERFVFDKIEKVHNGVLEFADLTLDFITDRTISHQLVRHRLCSFMQQSQRYVRYSDGIAVIRPAGYNPELPQWKIWLRAMLQAEAAYLEMLSYGATAQQARKVLPGSMSTMIRVKTNIREWRHIFNLRLEKDADPMMRELMQMAFDLAKNIVPIVFDDIQPQIDLKPLTLCKAKTANTTPSLSSVPSPGPAAIN